MFPMKQRSDMNGRNELSDNAHYCRVGLVLTKCDLPVHVLPDRIQTWDGVAGPSNAAPPREVSGDSAAGDSLPPVEASNSRLNQELS